MLLQSRDTSTKSALGLGAYDYESRSQALSRIYSNLQKNQKQNVIERNLGACWNSSQRAT